MSAVQNKAIVRHILEISWTGDLSAFDEHPGLREVIPFMRRMMSAMSDPHFTIVRQLADGDWVATHVTVEWTHTGEFMGMAPTGERVKSETIMLHQVVNGIIVRQHSQGGRVDRHLDQ